MTQRHLDIIAIIGFTALSLWGLVTALSLPAGAGDFPKIVFIILLCAGIAIILNVREQSEAALPFANIFWGRLFVVLSSLIVALISLDVLGFPLVCFFFFVIVQAAVSPERLSTALCLETLCVAVLVTASLTTVFLVFLGVSLPWGLLSRLF